MTSCAYPFPLLGSSPRVCHTPTATDHQPHTNQPPTTNHHHCNNRHFPLQVRELANVLGNVAGGGSGRNLMVSGGWGLGRGVGEGW